MTELLIKAQKYMNAEDTLAMIEVEEPWTSKVGAQDDPKRQKREKDDKTWKVVNFTPLVIPIEQILMQIKDGH